MIDYNAGVFGIFTKEEFLNRSNIFKMPYLEKEEIVIVAKSPYVAETFRNLKGEPSTLYFDILYSLYENKGAIEALESLGYTLESALQTIEGKKVLKDLDISLSRFLFHQDDDIIDGYDKALSEVKRGKKTSHWIWYIFPQLKELGKSWKSEYFGINGRPEAFAYINHPILRKRLIEITKAVLDSPYSVPEIFGNDAIKVYSCVKLFSTVCDEPVFKQLIKKENWH